MDPPAAPQASRVSPGVVGERAAGATQNWQLLELPRQSSEEGEGAVTHADGDECRVLPTCCASV